MEEGFGQRFEPQKNKAPTDTCSHGVSRSEVCQACVSESITEQPAWKMLEELKKTSKYFRSAENAPECTIEHDGKRYEIRLVQENDIATMAEIQKLSEETFGEDEVDSIDVLQAGIKGQLPDGSADIARYRLFVARDETGKIQSIYAGGLIEMANTDKQPSGEAVFMGAYGITRPENQRKGIVRELYISSIMQAAADAHAKNNKLVMIAGECTWGSELAWNAVGRRRVYVESGANEYTELPYIQPALDFNPKTGLPDENAGEVPEHLMVQFLQGEPNKERIITAVDSMYRWCNLNPQNFFDTPEAYAIHKEYIANIQKEFSDFLLSHGPLSLLSGGEREELKRKGVAIHEYTKADQNSVI